MVTSLPSMVASAEVWTVVLTVGLTKSGDMKGSDEGNGVLLLLLDFVGREDATPGGDNARSGWLDHRCRGRTFCFRIARNFVRRKI